MINVSVNGQKYQEMHVDGGTIAQAFLYPPSFSLKQMAALTKTSVRKFRKRKRIAYIVRNGRLSRPQETVKLQTLSAESSIRLPLAKSSPGLCNVGRETARNNGVVSRGISANPVCPEKLIRRCKAFKAN